MMSLGHDGCDCRAGRPWDLELFGVDEIRTGLPLIAGDPSAQVTVVNAAMPTVAPAAPPGGKTSVSVNDFHLY
jgi:hypothetical protein